MASAVGSYVTPAIVKARLSESASTWDPQLGVVCEHVNAYIEQTTGRVIAPVASAVYTLDGDGTDRLYFPRGIRAVTLLEIADYSGGSYATEAAGNRILRPAAHDRKPGWPAMFLYLSNQSTGHRWFPSGYDTVRMTATTGWDVIPDDIAEVAAVLAVRAFHALEQGNQPMPATGELGQPIVDRFVSGRDRDTLAAYRLPVV